MERNLYLIRHDGVFHIAYFEAHLDTNWWMSNETHQKICPDGSETIKVYIPELVEYLERQSNV